MYTIEYFKVDDTLVWVSMNILISLYLLHMIVVLLFFWYTTLSWIPYYLGIILQGYFILFCTLDKHKKGFFKFTLLIFHAC